MEIITTKILLAFEVPVVSDGPVESSVIPTLWDTILDYDSTGKLIPGFGLTTADISPDVKNITLNMRKGIKLHDGTDSTVEVVTLAYITYAEDVNRSSLIDLGYINSIEAIDDYTVQLNCNPKPVIGDLEIDGVLWDYIVMILKMHGGLHSPTYYKEHVVDWADTHPVGTGPFKFVSYEREVSIKYERFDEYWGGKPYIDGIEYHIIVDQMIQKAAFLTGARGWYKIKTII